MIKCVVYRGFTRETTVTKFASTRHLASLGILQVRCIECDGTGNWPFHPEQVHGGTKCVECKGTGRVYVSG